MALPRARQNAFLPRVPVDGKPKTTQEEFWMQQSTSGAINAFRQLTNTQYIGGRRRRQALPGGKLQPLFKNFTVPTKSAGVGSLGSKNVIPGIQTPPLLDSPTSMTQVYSGCYDLLPDPEQCTVRVYLASLNDDMQLEKETIYSKAVPEIQQYCSDHGVYFQLVDLNLSVPDGLHVSGDMRKQEIIESQNVSLGPNFVVLLGDRYGYVRVPQKLSKDCYELLNVTLNKKYDSQSLDLFKKAYSPTSKEPVSYELKALNDEELSSLQSVMYELMLLIMDEHEEEFFEMNKSVFDEELQCGIFSTIDPRSHCLCYHREWQGLSDDSTSTIVKDYMDINVKDGQPDKVARKLHRNQINSINNHLGITNYKPFYLQSEKVNEDSITTCEIYVQYLENLCNMFVLDMKQLIEQSIDRHSKIVKTQGSTYPEALFHNHLCRNLADEYIDHSNMLYKVEKFLRDPRQSHKALVIHGANGSGKSCLMAKTAVHIRDWSVDGSVIITRFIGTTSQSSDILPLVVSITMQICHAYGISTPDLRKEMSTLFQSLTVFHEVLAKVSKEHGGVKPLYILLDGISNMQPVDKCLKALWAIRNFPSNVYVVISTATELGKVNLVNVLTSAVADADACIEVSAPSVEEAKHILEASAMKNNYEITESVGEKLLKAYSDNRDMMFLHILLKLISKLQTKEDMELPKSATDDFHNLISHLEDKCGQTFVKYTLSYILISPVGIHEKELLDLLACNDEVMLEIKDKVTFDLELKHVPQALLSWLKFNLKGILTEHKSHNIALISLSNRQFAEIASKKYGVIYPGVDTDQINNDNTNYTLSLHDDMVQLYLDEHLSEDGTVLISPHPTNSQAMLKLTKLPYHMYVLLPVEGLDAIKKFMFFNFDWLKTKLTAQSVQDLYADLLPVLYLAKQFVDENIFENSKDYEDLEMMLEFLQLAEEALIQNPLMLPQEILARLSSMINISEDFGNLINETRKFLNQVDETALIPLHSCLPAPGSVLGHTLNGPSHVIKVLHNDTMIVTFNKDRGVELWRLDTGALAQRFNVNTEQKLDGIIAMNSGEFILIGHYSHLTHKMSLEVLSTATGVCAISADFDYNLEIIAMDSKDELLIATTEVTQSDGTKQLCILSIDLKSQTIVNNIAVNDVHKRGISKIIIVEESQQISNNKILSKTKEVAQSAEDPEGPFMQRFTNALITIGSKLSKDLAYWDLESETMSYVVELGCYPDLVKVSSQQDLAICICSTEGHLIVINLTNGERTISIEGDSKLKGMTDMYISKNGKFAVFCCPGQGVLVYSLIDGLIIKTIGDKYSEQQSKAHIVVLDESEKFIIIGYTSGTIRIYFTYTGELVRELHSHSALLTSLLITSTLKLISASVDGKTSVFNLGSVMTSWLQGVHDLADLDEELIFTNGSEKYAVQIPNKELGSLPCISDNYHLVSYYPTDSKIIAVHGATVSIYSAETAKLEQMFNAEKAVCDASLGYRGNLLIGHCDIEDNRDSKQLKVWNTRSADEVKFEDTSMNIIASCILPSGDKLFTLSSSQHKGLNASIFDLFEMKFIKTEALKHANGPFSYDNSFIHGISLRHQESPDVFTLELTESDSEEDNSNGQQAVTDMTVDHPLNNIAEESSSEGEQRSYTSNGVFIDKTPESLYVLMEHIPGGSTSFFYTLEIQMFEDDFAMYNLFGEPMEIETCVPNCSVLLNDGLVISGKTDGTLVMWDALQQRVLYYFTDPSLNKVQSKRSLEVANLAHEDAVTCLAASDDKQFLISGSTDCTIKLWSVTQKNLLQICIGHNGPIQSVSISGDGSYFVSGGADQLVYLWRKDIKKPAACFMSHSETINLDMSSDASRIVAKIGNRDPHLMILESSNI